MRAPRPARRHEDKDAALLWLLREVVPPASPTLVFAATRHHVEYLHTLLGLAGLQSACVYGQMDQARPAASCQMRPSARPPVLALPALAARARLSCGAGSRRRGRARRGRARAGGAADPHRQVPRGPRERAGGDRRGRARPGHPAAGQRHQLRLPGQAQAVRAPRRPRGARGSAPRACPQSHGPAAHIECCGVAWPAHMLSVRREGPFCAAREQPAACAEAVRRPREPAHGARSGGRAAVRALSGPS